MWTGCRVIWSLLIGPFRSRAALEAEDLVLRQQILVLRRIAPKRLSFNAIDRLILVGFYRLFPDVRSALAVVRPETVVRWHRAGFSEPCPSRKSYPRILMMQARQNGRGDNGSVSLDRPQQRRILVQ